MLIEKTEKQIKQRLPRKVFLVKQNFKHSTPKKLLTEYFKWRTPATVTDKGVICKDTANRSLIDLYKLVNTYYPKTPLKEILDILELLFKEKKIWCMWCPHIKRLVFKKGAVNYLTIKTGTAKPIALGKIANYDDLVEELNNKKINEDTRKGQAKKRSTRNNTKT